jgi:hypothetical protein
VSSKKEAMKQVYAITTLDTQNELSVTVPERSSMLRNIYPWESSGNVPGTFMESSI